MVASGVRQCQKVPYNLFKGGKVGQTTTVRDTVEQALDDLLERAALHDTLATGPNTEPRHREAERLFGMLVDIEYYYFAGLHEDAERLLRQEGVVIKGW